MSTATEIAHIARKLGLAQMERFAKSNKNVDDFLADKDETVISEAVADLAKISIEIGEQERTARRI